MQHGVLQGSNSIGMEFLMITKMPDSEYFAADGVSKSKLTAFMKIEDQEPETSTSMAFGSLAHCMVLEPDCVNERYFVTSADRRGTKAWSADEEEAAGRILVKREEYDQAMLLAQSILDHDEASRLIDGAKAEMAVFWEDPGTGLPCKAKMDAFHDSDNALILDLKTTQSIKKRDFAKSVMDYRYDIQAVHYTRGVQAHEYFVQDFLFIAVEKKAKLIAGTTARRHQIGLFRISPELYQIAERELDDGLKTFAYALRTGDWPVNTSAIQQIEAPTWKTEDFA
jgi:hypothetical protein